MRLHVPVVCVCLWEDSGFYVFSLTYLATAAATQSLKWGLLRKGRDCEVAHCMVCFTSKLSCTALARHTTAEARPPVRHMTMVGEGRDDRADRAASAVDRLSACGAEGGREGEGRGEEMGTQRAGEGHHRLFCNIDYKLRLSTKRMGRLCVHLSHMERHAIGF